MNEQRLRLSISFREEYRHIYEHLQKQPNRSDYICRILQKEMENEKSFRSLEGRLEEILLTLTKRVEISASSNLVQDFSDQLEHSLQENDIELINELFN